VGEISVLIFLNKKYTPKELVVLSKICSEHAKGLTVTVIGVGFHMVMCAT